MFLPAFRLGRSRAARRNARCGPHWRTQFLPLLVPRLLLSQSSPVEAMPHASGAFGGGFLFGTVLAVLVGCLARTGIKAAQRETAKWKELANHREYERNLAPRSGRRNNLLPVVNVKDDPRREENCEETVVAPTRESL